MKMQGQKGKCKDKKENARMTKKSYSLDRFEQVERPKIFEEMERGSMIISALFYSLYSFEFYLTTE
jgi:hypothetical protein